MTEGALHEVAPFRASAALTATLPPRFICIG
jgi:hypothetical protein